MLLNVLMVSDQGNSWDIWLHIVELKSTLTRLRQLTIYSHLGIPPEANRDGRCFKPIRLQISRQVQAFLSVVEQMAGMTMVQKMGGKVMEIFSDSKLVVGQVQGELEARDLRIQEYLSQVRHLQSRFESFNLSQIPRNRNTHSNSLTTLETSSAQSLSPVILVEDLCKPTEVGKNVTHIHQIRVGPN